MQSFSDVCVPIVGSPKVLLHWAIVSVATVWLHKHVVSKGTITQDGVLHKILSTCVVCEKNLPVVRIGTPEGTCCAT